VTVPNDEAPEDPAFPKPFAELLRLSPSWPGEFKSMANGRDWVELERENCPVESSESESSVDPSFPSGPPPPIAWPFVCMLLALAEFLGGPSSSLSSPETTTAAQTETNNSGSRPCIRAVISLIAQIGKYRAL